MKQPAPDTTLVRNAYEGELNEHWEAKTHDDINLLLGAEDGLYHHHYAVGDFDRMILAAPPAVREQLILTEMHRLETEQVNLITDGLGRVPATARVMDAGSGRGGTSFMIHQRFGCQVEGVNFCSHHHEFAQELAIRHGCQDQVGFNLANMVDTPFSDGSFDYIVSNETTMYVDLDEAFAEFARLLRPGGRYVLVTWCRNDAVAETSPDVEAIDEHYVCHIHRRSTYLRALLEHDLIPSTVADLTTEAIPYWELRTASQLATGVEAPFLNAYRMNQMNYLVIVAERKPSTADGRS
ncbi:methyltransferase domain-containing protein [Nonomuraea rosea]|uniref:Methyltransferase domain-containing protein n=1 Tax=Nonomuraea rosea TaxID=638574 RepID=A0ABP6X341_9ACTN